MKLTILLLVLASAIVNAADEQNSLTKSVVQHEIPGTAATRVSQQFEEADISLAVAQYKRLRELAFALRMKLELEEIKDAERDALAQRIDNLHQRATALRSEVEARANKSAAAK